MQVKVIKKFFDRQNDKLQEKGTSFDAENSRAEKLIQMGLVEEVKTKPSDKTQK